MGLHVVAICGLVWCFGDTAAWGDAAAVTSSREQLKRMDGELHLITPSATFAQEERSRLLVVPHRIRKTPAKEIQLDSNSLRNFSSIDLKDVWSIAYVSQLRQVLLATHSLARIVSYQLDTKDTRSVKTGVIVNGMGVDEGRQLVFLSTRRPNVTVSRMSTNGRHFRNIARVEWLPYSVAVDAQRTVIYVACTTRLVSMDYEGQRLQVVYIGDYMYSASWDSIASAVYFNDFKSVMKMTPGDTEATEVYELSYIASNVVFYNRTIYIGSYCGHFVDALHLDEDNTTHYNSLQTLPFTYFMNICLLP